MLLDRSTTFAGTSNGSSNQLTVLVVEMKEPLQLGPRQHPELAVPRHHTLIPHSRS